jgi:sulfite reductase alpha subunit-like flavoprotein
MLIITDPSSCRFGNDSCFFIITSTTGNGEPPHHAISFKGAMEDAKSDENQNQSLKGLKYAVFALGSSIYPNFCSFGIYCDDSIASLGKYPYRH